jgi:hypothetical protein
VRSFGGGAAPPEATFDRVIYVLPSGRSTTLSRQEFDDLPLAERIRAILNKSFRFYRGDTEVPLKEALKDR